MTEMDRSSRSTVNPASAASKKAPPLLRRDEPVLRPVRPKLPRRTVSRRPTEPNARRRAEYARRRTEAERLIGYIDGDDRPSWALDEERARHSDYESQIHNSRQTEERYALKWLVETELQRHVLDVPLTTYETTVLGCVLRGRHGWAYEVASNERHRSLYESMGRQLGINPREVNRASISLERRGLAEVIGYRGRSAKVQLDHEAVMRLAHVVRERADWWKVARLKWAAGVEHFGCPTALVDAVLKAERSADPELHGMALWRTATKAWRSYAPSRKHPCEWRHDADGSLVYGPADR